MIRPRGISGRRVAVPVGLLVAFGALLSLRTGTDPATDQPAAMAPSLLGFMGAATGEQPYAPGRLLVQIRAGALERVPAELVTDKGARAAEPRLGLDKVDALALGAGVKAIDRAYAASPRREKAATAGADRWLMYRFENVKDLPALAAEFAALADVEAVSLDWRAWPSEVPTDPGLVANWGHENTAQLPSYNWDVTHRHTGPGTGLAGFDADVPQAWELVQRHGSAEIVIAIIDSGVDTAHDDLRLVAGYDFGDDDADPDDDAAGAGHGTCCAGIAAALADGSGAVGVAPGCSIMPLKVADGDGAMYFSAVQAALYHAADHGAAIVSMSFGAPIKTDAATEAALRYAYEAGVVLVAATGNRNQPDIDYPAASPWVIAVGAAAPGGERKRSSHLAGEVNPGVAADTKGCTDDGERWWGSSYGSPQKDAADAVDLLGPTILPTCDITGPTGYRSDGYEPFFNGTSCAAPYVAGVAALVLSAHPDWTPGQVREALVGGARDVIDGWSEPGWDRHAGYGLVNALAALGGETVQVGDPEPESGTATTPEATSAAVLEQNQPNPFNPVTRVAFNLPRAGRVRLSVYDLRGERVAVLADGELDAGRHEITWDAGDRASGIYLCRLEAPGVDETRKMTLLK